MYVESDLEIYCLDMAELAETHDLDRKEELIRRIARYEATYEEETGRKFHDHYIRQGYE